MHPVEAVVQGLVVLWRDEQPVEYLDDGKPATLEVVDGPPLDDPDNRRTLYVGTGAELAAGVTEERSYELAGVTYTIDVGAELLVWAGDNDPARVRRDAMDTMHELDARVASDRTFTGSVDWARILREVYTPLSFEGGSGASVQFIVRVQASRPHP